MLHFRCMKAEKEVVSTGYICQKTGLSRMHVSRLAKAGEIPSAFKKKDGSHWRFVLNLPLQRWIHVTIATRNQKPTLRKVRRDPQRDANRKKPFPGNAKFQWRKSGSLNVILNAYRTWLARTARDEWTKDEYENAQQTLGIIIGDFCGRFGYRLQRVEKRVVMAKKTGAMGDWQCEWMWDKYVKHFTD